MDVSSADILETLKVSFSQVTSKIFFSSRNAQTNSTNLLPHSKRSRILYFLFFSKFRYITLCNDEMLRNKDRSNFLITIDLLKLVKFNAMP